MLIKVKHLKIVKEKGKTKHNKQTLKGDTSSNIAVNGSSLT